MIKKLLFIILIIICSGCTIEVSNKPRTIPYTSDDLIRLTLECYELGYDSGVKGMDRSINSEKIRNIILNEYGR